MSNRTPFRIIACALILTLLSIPKIYDAGAQEQSRSPQPKQTQQQQNDPKEKTGSQLQSGQAIEQVSDKEGTIKIDTELVMLDVTVIDHNDNPIFNLKKEDFSVFEDGSNKL